LRCRRRNSSRLILLNKKWSQDNNIYRCQECGFLFSPAEPRDIDPAKIEHQDIDPPGSGAPADVPDLGSASRLEASRTVAVSSGFCGRA